MLEHSPPTPLKTRLGTLWVVKEDSTQVRNNFSKIVNSFNFPSGTSNLQRAALGDIKNVANARHNSVSTDEPSKDFKQPLKPLATRRLDWSRLYSVLFTRTFSETRRRRRTLVLFSSSQRMRSRLIRWRLWTSPRLWKMCKCRKLRLKI